MPATELDDLDVTSPDFFARPDYYDVLRRLRTEAPVCPAGPDTWTVARYEDIRAISRDPARFTSTRGVIINDPARSAESNLSASSVIHMDPPDHSSYRKTVNGQFTPMAVSRMEPAVRATVCDVLDRAPEGEEFDAVAHLTAPVPVLVIANLLGISDGDVRDFQRWSDAMIEFSDARRAEHQSADGQGAVDQQAGAELFSFLNAHIASRYDRPGDDLISLLAGASFDGHSLDREQVLMFCLTLLVAGNETTRHLLSGGMHALAENTAQRARLVADPTRIPMAGEEMLRWVTPIQAMGRTANHDLEIGGRSIREGDYLIMLYASGNRDETMFGPSADRFDISRPVSPTHVAFGFGEHLCLGASLARLEVRIFFEELLARHPAFEVTSEPEWTRSTLVHGPRSMSIILR